MFEVGKTYRADGQEFTCVFTTEKYAWLSGNLDVGQTAYVWSLDGKANSLGSIYDIVFDDRYKEIELLKAEIEALKAVLRNAN